MRQPHSCFPVSLIVPEPLLHANFRPSTCSTSDMYTITDITEIVNDYISSHGLINPNDQQYINVGTDQALASAVSIKGQDAEFLKLDVVLKRVRTNMQAWYEIRLEGREVIRKYVTRSCTVQLLSHCGSRRVLLASRDAGKAN